MSLDELYYTVQIKKNIEFTYNNITYKLSYDKTPSGEDIIKFGPLYEEKSYKTYGEFINLAMVENHLFKYFIVDQNF